MTNFVGQRGDSFNMETFTGRLFNLANPRAEDVCEEDIAHHLAQENRYCGAAMLPISVLTHSIIVGQVVGRMTGDSLATKYAVLHDGHEYAAKDVHRPLKALLRDRAGSVYDQICESIQRVIHIHFGLPSEPSLGIKKVIKIADDAVCRSEAAEFMATGGESWEWGNTKLVRHFGHVIGEALWHDLYGDGQADYFHELLHDTEREITRLNDAYDLVLPKIYELQAAGLTT